MSTVSASSQLQAAHPDFSIFLTANAGSGKTSTLVNRVARLLLTGTRPEHILCVTYTKAAAAEMQSRLFERLGKWAVETDEALAKDLADIDEAGADLSQARTLFAKALETPGGLKIQTIHAFCEKLLRRFPLEAGLSPGFEVIDDFLGKDLKARARAQLLCLEAKDYPQVAQSRDRLITRLKEFNFEKLLSQCVLDHDKIRFALDQIITDEAGLWLKTFYKDLGLDACLLAEDILTDLGQTLNWDQIKALAESLAKGTSATNLKAARNFLQVRAVWLSEQRLDFETLWSIFFTNGGTRRAKSPTKEATPSDICAYERLFETIAPLKDRLNAADIAKDTLDFIRLFNVFSAFYTQLKAERGVLDFQDMIHKTRQLLSQSQMSQWVLFKLDQGLDHILVDEAQDTSEAQWDIVNALSCDFFSGAGQTDPNARTRIRTFFAVGDEKQSIYGFQGARPDAFLTQAQQLDLKVNAAKQKFKSPALQTSYRSLPCILDFVDAAFANPELCYALLLDEAKSVNLLTHKPHRTEAPGLVELWPPVLSFKTEEGTVDDQLESAPVDDNPEVASAQKRLAMQIAAQVKKALDEGHGVYDRGVLRPLTAGDILILVRSRKALFEHIIRELKKVGVAVSGADRLQIGDHIAFADIRALMRVCMQPHDDLALACVLRSPLCSLKEEDLFVLSHDRKTPLWTALNRKSGPPFEEAKTLIGWAIETSKTHTTFDFLSRLYNRRDPEGVTYRQRFLTRLGQECLDVLNETLGLALKAEGVGAIGLIGALNIFEYHAAEIKREQEDGAQAVRIMTVHGSKGLEAPWILLPMEPQYKTSRNENLVLIDENKGLFLSQSAATDCARTSQLRQTLQRKNEMEALRLYYVAITRARDRLTLCGYWGKKTPPENAYPQWYSLSEQAFERLAPEQVGQTGQKAVVPFTEDREDEIIVTTFGQWPDLAKPSDPILPVSAPLPDYFQHLAAPVEESLRKWAAISQLGDEDRAQDERAPSPLLQSQGLGRFLRGNIIHKLFEILPEVRLDNRLSVAEKFLLRQTELDAAQRSEICASVFSVLNDSRFAEAFGPHSRPEIAIAGKIGKSRDGLDLMLSGRIDRLVITPERVLILDYKSNRPAPDTAEKAPIDYQRQMAGYVALMRQIHPHKTVEAALLWTDGPKLTPLSEALINQRLSEILTH